MIVSIKNSNLENLFLFMVIKSSFMFINILYYWIYMETRTKYGFGSFKNLDQGEYEITEIKTKPAEVQAFCYYQNPAMYSTEESSLVKILFSFREFHS